MQAHPRPTAVDFRIKIDQAALRELPSCRDSAFGISLELALCTAHFSRSAVARVKTCLQTYDIEVVIWRPPQPHSNAQRPDVAAKTGFERTLADFVDHVERPDERLVLRTNFKLPNRRIRHRDVAEG